MSWRSLDTRSPALPCPRTFLATGYQLCLSFVSASLPMAWRNVAGGGERCSPVESWWRGAPLQGEDQAVAQCWVQGAGASQNGAAYLLPSSKKW